MDSEKILKLIDAGFTAEEIRKMEPQETLQPDQGGTNETPAEEKGQEPQANEGAVGSEVFAQLSKTVADLTKTVQDMQKSNIDNALSADSLLLCHLVRFSVYGISITLHKSERT